MFEQKELTVLTSCRGRSCLWRGSTSREFCSQLQLYQNKRQSINQLGKPSDIVIRGHKKETVIENRVTPYLSFVMTMPAIKDLIATWGSNLASPTVMFAPKTNPHTTDYASKYAEKLQRVARRKGLKWNPIKKERKLRITRDLQNQDPSNPHLSQQIQATVKLIETELHSPLSRILLWPAQPNPV